MGGGVVCTVIFISNPTVVLCCVGVGVLTISYALHGNKMYSGLCYVSQMDETGSSIC